CPKFLRARKMGAVRRSSICCLRSTALPQAPKRRLDGIGNHVTKSGVAFPALMPERVAFAEIVNSNNRFAHGYGSITSYAITELSPFCLAPLLSLAVMVKLTPGIRASE